MKLRELSYGTLHFRLQQLLAEYVELIDDDRLEQWPELFVERAVYKVLPRENSDRRLPAAAVFCDSRGMLTDRVVSLQRANIYAVHYHRLVLSNLRIVERGDDEVRTQCNYFVFQTRASGETSIYSTGKYEDRIVGDDGSLRLKEKQNGFDTYRIDSLMVRPLKIRMTMMSTSIRSAHATAGAAESSFRVPYGVFTEPSYYARQQARIFRGQHWSFVALEAEIPKSGDYKTTFIGDTPVIVMRGADGKVHVTVNRCAHRGALVVRDLRGNRSSLECVYHQWCYAPDGKLVGLPSHKGSKGQGAMPADFDMKQHLLQRLRVEVLHGLVFATFSGETPPLNAYLEPMVVESLARIFRRSIRVLGDLRQYVHGNWKLYAENTRDPYHASLLHLLHTTFGTYRSSQKGGVKLDAEHRHSIIYASSDSNDAQKDQGIYKDMRSFNAQFKLQIHRRSRGGVSSTTASHLSSCRCFRTSPFRRSPTRWRCARAYPMRPTPSSSSGRRSDADDEEMQTIRLKQGNLIGPAGVISMEDGEAVEIVQRAVVRDQDKTSFIAMGGGRAGNADHLVTESSIIGIWEYYQKAVGFDPVPVC